MHFFKSIAHQQCRRSCGDADVGNAVNPKWRTAQTHGEYFNCNILLVYPCILSAGDRWCFLARSFTPAEVEAVKEQMTHHTSASPCEMTNETDSGAYSNEADVRESDFQTTFFGTNYPKLKSIKEKYDSQWALQSCRRASGARIGMRRGVCRVN